MGLRRRGGFARRVGFAALIVLGVLAALLGTGAVRPNHAAAAACPTNICIADFSFTPSTVTGSAPMTITWTNQGAHNHTVTRCPVVPSNACTGAPAQTCDYANALNGTTPLSSGGGTYTAPLSYGCNYTFYCHIHGYNTMHGSITLTGTAGPTPPPTPTPPPPTPTPTPRPPTPTPVPTVPPTSAPVTSGPAHTSAPATSAAAGQTTGTSTSVSLTTSAQPGVVAQPLTLTATVASGSGTPNGTVTFKDGATVIGAGSLVAGKVSVIAQLEVGSHSLTASYAGEGAWASSSSAILTETMQSGGTPGPAAGVTAAPLASASASPAVGSTSPGGGGGGSSGGSALPLVLGGIVVLGGGGGAAWWFLLRKP